MLAVVHGASEGTSASMPYDRSVLTPFAAALILEQHCGEKLEFFTVVFVIDDTVFWYWRGIARAEVFR